MQGATVHLAGGTARIVPGDALPVAALLVGRPVAEAADMLPRLFNLCRTAQGAAARMALGLPPGADPTAEIIRDHAVLIGVRLRAAFGLPPDMTVPGPLPRDLGGLAVWVGMGSAEAALAQAIIRAFPRGRGVTGTLPPPVDPLGAGAAENSPAGRQAGHPLLRAVAMRDGRGPLWRYLGLLADAEAARAGCLPPPRMVGDTAVVQAARGVYALRITQADGRVTGLQRRTPTDHMLAPGGALEQALACVDATLAPKVIALHDPCVPVNVREAAHA
jgi:hypothetical protein